MRQKTFCKLLTVLSDLLMRSLQLSMCMLALAGAALAQTQQPAPLGKRVDLGGYSFHINCTGHGSQTVVLSPGGGDFSFVWTLVHKPLEADFRVCSYDRPGTAWSDPGPQPVTLRQEASELESALRTSGEKMPYILVGHSIGGLVVRTFAEGFPDEVAGVVLVDSPSPDATMGYNGKLVRIRDLAKRSIPPVQTLQSSPPTPASNTEQEQALKYKSHRINPPYDRLPADIQALQLWAQTLPPSVSASAQDDYTPEEWQFLWEVQNSGHPLGNKPLIVMLAMREDLNHPPDVSAERWHSLYLEKIEQKRNTKSLSTNSKVVEVKNSGHAIHLEQPQAVVQEIREVASASRSKTNLR